MGYTCTQLWQLSFIKPSLFWATLMSELIADVPHPCLLKWVYWLHHILPSQAFSQQECHPLCWAFVNVTPPFTAWMWRTALPPLQIHQSTTGPCPNPLLNSIHHPQYFNPPLCHFGWTQHWAEFCRAQLFHAVRVGLEGQYVFPTYAKCAVREYIVVMDMLWKSWYVFCGLPLRPWTRPLTVRLVQK